MKDKQDIKKENNIKYILKQIIYALFVVCIAVIIFSFSNEVADESSNTSAGVIERLINLIYKDITQEELIKKIEILQPIIRKCAHFILYASLGFFTYNFVRTIKRNILKNRENTAKTFLIISQIFCTTYSISDEIHQKFIPGRSAELRDVIIDSLGALTGILVCIVFLRLIEKIVINIKEKINNN